MAKKKTSKVWIGLFVIIGSVIGVGSIVWLGASKCFEGGKAYVAYFDESIQGLHPDSSVKLRGVNIGRVERIGVEPETAMVEVVMKLNVDERLREDLCAELKLAGLTGIVYIDLDRKRDGETLEAPPHGRNPPYPLIPSRPSRTKQLLDRLESATAHVDGTFHHTDRLLAGGSVDHVLNGTKDTIAEARATLKGIRTEMEAMKLQETSGQAQRLLESLETDSRRISADLKETAGNLRQVSENLEGLVDRVRADPSEILFSSAPLPRPRQEIKP
jgi:phospholipid/cholesterol/gamma-HCH transport system substrate-binding protein